MKPWEIWTFDGHPCVLLSNAARLARKPIIELLRCSSQRADRRPGPTEVLLDPADGLVWETLCYCDLILSAPRDTLSRRRGLVTPARRAQIVSTLISAHEWNQLHG